jgi:uncharacterized protein (DUF1499 family)
MSGKHRVFILLFVIALAGCATTTEVFSMEERFAPCPDSPNCVSSYADDELHGIPALPLSGSDPMETLVSAVESFPRTEIVTREGDYLHVTFTSLVFRFVDDVEFRIDREAGVIHVRSASRVGYGDMNVNRDRVESIRAKLEAGVEP